MLSYNALQYTLNHLLYVALPTEPALDYLVERAEGVVTVRFAGGWSLHIALLTDAETQAVLSGEAQPVSHLTADGRELIPLFRPATGGAVECSDVYTSSDTRDLHIPYDLITPSFLMLSRWEEYQESPRDSYNRHPYLSGMAARYGFIHLPIADEYAMLLRRWVVELLRPDIRLCPRTPRIVPTHDIDHLCRFTGTLQAMRSILGRDLLINRSLSIVRQSWQEYRNWRADKWQDPYVLAVSELVGRARRRNEQAVFFLKAQAQGEYDCTYDVNDPLVRHIVNLVLENGMEVGLHGSFRSYDNPELYGREKRRLEEIMGKGVTCGRQHFLRFNLLKSHANAGYSYYTGTDVRRMMEMAHPSTLEVWQAADIGDDYTLGYAEQPGFRCGTCHPYPLYDVGNDCATDIVEHPLILMDGTLFDYLKLSPEESAGRASRLRERCRAVEGDFVYLWHNHTLGRNYRDFYEAMDTIL